MSTYPTRLDVETALALHVGQGKAAMEQAVRNTKVNYPKMTDEEMDRIVSDLMSYPSYANES